MDEVMNMNRRTWKEFITKRSTIWTLSLCLVGAIVLGGMAAVNHSRSGDDAQTETELGQIAWLDEDEDANGESTNDEDADMDSDSGAANNAASSDTDEAAAASGTDSDTTDVSTDLILGDDSYPSSDISGTDAGENTDSMTDGTDAGENTDSSAEDSSDTADDTSADGVTSESDTAGTADDSSDTVSADSEEAASANIISEQALIDAGVSFTDDQSILWPSAGTIVIDYSMDKSVYFQTLNQYKYNPALIISSDTGNQVLAAARGIVESISVDEETGTTLVLNIGNGYRLTYGQLMEPAVSEGDVVEAGDLLAYISEPTKYYSTEGSNLYFAMTKDGEPVDPVLYLE